MFVRKLTKIRLSKPIINNSLLRYAFSQVPKMDPNKDYYRILDVPRDINTDQIEYAYSKLVHIYDPAINPANRQKYEQILEARSILGNERLRKQYDKQRFFVKFTDQIKTRFQRQHQEPYETKQKDRYSFDLTPQENEVFQKTRRFFKRVFIVGIGLALFLPFLLYEGGGQSSVNQAGYAMRPSSIQRAESTRRKNEYQQSQQAYQQQHPSSSHSQNYAQGYENPNIIVTGQIVQD